ncbi:MAG: prepilin-type N-terminal cleavage/methylation domain-containing protein, partial [Patescibacteria group bacterium]
MTKFKKGFTLVELLVVMGILGILVSLVAGNFRSSQIRGRDAQRKSDLKQIATALELFYGDYGYYPVGEDGYIMACFFEEGVGGSRCDWGIGNEFKDVFPGTVSPRTIYLKNV